ncbi:MAG: cadmium resistance transporter [Chloroflexi bacterium]|nr:cadmium resistance transporter [Chloroflexota bacterium]MCC6895430.1 cadmium resistance transporter [Anaerolineae bacterium]
MPGILLIIGTAALAFITTNIDDILLIMLFFAGVNAVFRKRHIIVGQYLGFGAIMIISLLGFAGALILPESIIGLLGIIPIGMGVVMLFRKDDDEDADEEAEEVAHAQPTTGLLASLISTHTLRVAGITLANGADNVSVYVPLFASQTPQEVALTIAVFGVGVGALCYAAYRLVRYPKIAKLIDRYGERLVPYVFILLGVYILLESLMG